MTPDEYLEMITEPAKAVCRTYDLPYACVVAQGAVESSWGNAGIGKGGYNLFGRKWGGSGDYVVLSSPEDDGTGKWTNEDSKFQSYDSMEDAVKDWCGLMLWVKDNGEDGPYVAYARQYQQDHDVEAFVRGIASVYADDIHYGDKLMQTIRACGLC